MIFDVCMKNFIWHHSERNKYFILDEISRMSHNEPFVTPHSHNNLDFGQGQGKIYKCLQKPASW